MLFLLEHLAYAMHIFSRRDAERELESTVDSPQKIFWTEMLGGFRNSSYLRRRLWHIHTNIRDRQ